MSEHNSNDSIHYENKNSNDIKGENEEGNENVSKEDDINDAVEDDMKQKQEFEGGKRNGNGDKDPKNNFKEIENYHTFNSDINETPESREIQTNPYLKEQQAASLAFSKMMENQTNSAEAIDKEKLFETFLLFQNFINMKQTMTSPQLLNSNQENGNKYSSGTNKNLDESGSKGIQDHISKIDIENTEDPSNFILKTQENQNVKVNKHSSDKKESSYDNNENDDNKTNQQQNKYDEIPIKPINTNFMELLEKELANDNTALNPSSTGNVSALQKKRPNKASSTHQKRTINISKPSKNDKKYTYYTDWLDDQGHINDEKLQRIPTSTKWVSNHQSGVTSHNNPTSSVISNSTGNASQQVAKGKNDKDGAKMEQQLLSNEPHYSEAEEKPRDFTKIEKIIDTNNKPNSLNLVNSDNSNGDLNSHNNHTASSKELLIDRKIREWNTEIVKSKEEKEKINKLKNEYEKIHKRLQEDIEAFNTKKNEFEKWREEELKNIQKEKKNIHHEVKQNTALKQQNQSLWLLNKRDKETIEVLKNQISKIQNENKWKDQNTKWMFDKFKKQIDEWTKKMNSENGINEGYPGNNNEHLNNGSSWQSRGKSSNQSNSQKTFPKSNTIGKFTTKQGNSGKENNLDYGNGNEGIERKYISDNNSKNTTKQPRDKLTKNNTFSSPSTVNEHNSPNNTKPKIISSYNSVSKISGLKAPSNSTQIQTYQKPKIPDTKSPNKQSELNNINTNQIQVSTCNMKSNIPPGKHQINTSKFPAFSKDEYDFKLPEKYHNNKYDLIKSVTSNEGKTIKLYTNNKREVTFQSGVKKEIYEDGYQIVYFTNGDLKQIFPTGKSVYFFKEANTVQSTFSDGWQVFKFQNGQIEKHYPDGIKQIAFPDGSWRYIMSDGYEETHYPDGSIHKVDQNNVVTIENLDERVVQGGIKGEKDDQDDYNMNSHYNDTVMSNDELSGNSRNQIQN